jgi:hypothetical protein
MQALDEHEACAVGPHQDWRLLAIGEHALRYFLYALWIKRGPPLDRHVDIVDREVLAFHHGTAKHSMLRGVYPPRAPNANASPFPVRAASPHACQHQGDTAAMSEPLIVVIPHRLGKDEALRRIKDGLGRAKSEFAWLMSLEEEVWTGDRLTFRVAALGQRAWGIIDVYEAGVRLEVVLPWLLARFAHAVQRVIGQKGHLMLEKK